MEKTCYRKKRGRYAYETVAATTNSSSAMLMLASGTISNRYTPMTYRNALNLYIIRVQIEYLTYYYIFAYPIYTSSPPVVS